MLLYLIRHGETAWNADGRFQGQTDTLLNDIGRAQAGVVARIMDDWHVDAVYSSDLARAAETAEIIAATHGLIPIPDVRLREISFGEWEGLSLAEATERWPDIVASWRADSLHTRPPGGETQEAVRQRVVEFTAEIVRQHPEGSICVVGHGGSLRMLVAQILGTDPTIYRRLRLDNCSISVVRFYEEKASLLLLNDICHLGQRIPPVKGENPARARIERDAPAPR